MAGNQASTKKRTEGGLPLGLGDAVLRLIHVVAEAQTGVRDGEGYAALLRERELLLEALNRIPLEDLRFDCDGDGAPDTGSKPISIFEASATTSCCRILAKRSERTAPRKPQRKSR